jgi:DNA-binding transcriptional regulator YhcF (GntR family)
VTGPDLSVDTTSPVPPYEQLRARIAAGVADGSLPAGTRLATVRQLAADLGLAANTVARAYRELEADGVVATQGRRGTFVRSDVLAGPGSRTELAVEFAATARRLGLTLPEATRLVEQAWPR